jgi:hypothetical protein
MRAESVRRPGRLIVPLACLALLGCGGKGADSGGGTAAPPPPLPTFQCHDSAVTVDQVALKCAVNLSQDVWQIAVVIGSPTTSMDIDAFAFDLLLDPTAVQYVPNSALAGNMLAQGGNTPLLGAALVAGDPNRLRVGIARTGGAPGVQGTTQFNEIMRFSVRRVPGAQFDANPMHIVFDQTDSQAYDSSVPKQPISITFSDQLLLSNQ